jgi:hypothetical protein
MSHEHLSDEQLSAYIDREPLDEPAAPDVDAAVASCAQCQERLAALEEARTLVRLPVAHISRSVRAAAVAAALADARSDARSDATNGSLTIGDARSVPSTTSVRRSSRWARVPAGAVAAVLIVVALAAGIPIALSHSGSRPTSSAASHAAAKRAATAAPSAASASGAGTAAALPDLGAIGSPKSLRSHLGPVVASGRYDQEFNSTSGLSALAPQSDSAGQSAGAPLGPATQSTSQFAKCVAAARQVAGADDTVVLVATVTYEHSPAVVVVVRIPTTSGRQAPHLAVVVARSDCRTLTRTSF